MPKSFSRIAGVALAVALASTVAAQAQDRQVRRAKLAKANQAVVIAEIKAPPLTVQKRSFLDPGNVVSPYSGNGASEYLAANTFEHRPIYANFAPGRFGESTLPGRYDVPYNPRYFPERDLDFSPF